MWYRIMLAKEWFGEMIERHKLIRDFNRSAKNSFISGEAPTLLEARITIGDPNYKHAFSKWRGGGYRIKALSGKPLEKSELMEIGKIIISNTELTRKLVSLGWDTLEVHANEGFLGLKWQLTKFTKFGGILE